MNAEINKNNAENKPESKSENKVSSKAENKIENEEELLLAYNSGVKFMQAKDYNKALTVFQDLCTRFPNHIFFKALAGCLQEKKEYLSAILSYKTAYLLAPASNQDCLFFSGVCYYKHGQFQKAKTELEEFLILNVDNEYQVNRAKIYIESANKKLQPEK